MLARQHAQGLTAHAAAGRAMDEDEQQAAAGAEARRGRPSLRQRQAAAGLVEVKEWVRKEDAERAYALLESLVEAGRQQFTLHRRLGQGDAVAVEVRFSGVPPAVFREQLRREWGLEWDRAAWCWRGDAGQRGCGEPAGVGSSPRGHGGGGAGVMAHTRHLHRAMAAWNGRYAKCKNQEFCTSSDGPFRSKAGQCCPHPWPSGKHPLVVPRRLPGSRCTLLRRSMKVDE